MTREEIIKRIRYANAVTTDDKLMDKLQDRGLISDLCVHIDDVADRDLINVYLLQVRI